MHTMSGPLRARRWKSSDSSCRSQSSSCKAVPSGKSYGPSTPPQPNSLCTVGSSGLKRDCRSDMLNGGSIPVCRPSITAAYGIRALSKLPWIHITRSDPWNAYRLSASRRKRVLPMPDGPYTQTMFPLPARRSAKGASICASSLLRPKNGHSIERGGNGPARGRGT